MQSINPRTLIISFLFLLSAIIYVVLGQSNSLLLTLLFIFITSLILFDSFLKAWNNKCIMHFISIANLFIFAIFVLRPLQLLLANDLGEFPTLRLYFSYYGYLLPKELPWAQASFIGMLGTFFLNCPFLTSSPKNLFRVLPLNKFRGPYIFSKSQLFGLFSFILISIISASIFLFKIQTHIAVHIYDLLWIFIFSCIAIYIITRKRADNWLIYFLLGLAIFILSFSGKRQYIVNFLLCCIIPLYFVGTDRKKIFRRIFLMFILILIIVFGYGAIRRYRIGNWEQKTFGNAIMGEFCMYDMLLASIDYVRGYALNAFWGKHYLNIFTIGIPGLHIQPFDHFLTEIIFKGNFHGAIPTSLFGSLYFNFLLPGVCIGSYILGIFLMYVQKKLARNTSYENIGYYAIFATFVYDLIRVGDIGRELWSLITLLLVYGCFNFLMNKFKKASISNTNISQANNIEKK